jgi:protein-tyrosine-phosphatase
MLKILFVCGGNTCRSPIAASLASAVMKTKAEVKSAGMDAWGQPASPKVIELMLDCFGIDLSAHRSRDVEDVSLPEFDYIVAMKPEYKERIVHEFKVPAEKIIEWDVEDPWIEGTDRAYEECLHNVQELLRSFLTLIESRS